MNKKQLELLVKQLTTDATYNCLTRQGLELMTWPAVSETAKYAVFCDIDDMHERNFELGYNEVDARITRSINIRSTDIHATARWYSGDEIVWIIGEGDPQGLAARIQSNFKSNGLSATFGIAPITSTDLKQNVDTAAALVQDAKTSGRRGTINSK